MNSNLPSPAAVPIIRAQSLRRRISSIINDPMWAAASSWTMWAVFCVHLGDILLYLILPGYCWLPVSAVILMIILLIVEISYPPHVNPKTVRELGVKRHSSHGLVLVGETLLLECLSDINLVLQCH
jgi:hypothetical protein